MASTSSCCAAPVYEQLLGVDYPLFIGEPDDAPRLLTGSALDADKRRDAAAACRAASAAFTVTRVAERIAAELPTATAPAVEKV